MSSQAQIFDYKIQGMSFVMADGTTPVMFNLNDIEVWSLYNINASISYGVQAGACGLLFITTAILTRNNKRGTPVHILNLLSLLFGFIRAFLQALYFTSSWNEFYTYFSGEFSQISTQDYLISILSTISQLFFAASVTCSLLLQAHIVTKLLSRIWHLVITSLSILVLLLGVGFRFANAVLNCIAIINKKSYYSFHWLEVLVLATETLTIWFFSFIFTGKLFYTIWSRKKLGLNRWGYFQILSIMGTCTMIIPSIFAILDYVDFPTFPSIGAWPLTIVALLLPLSSLWASTVINEPSSNLGIAELLTGKPCTICKSCACGPLEASSTASRLNPISNRASANTVGTSRSATSNSQTIGVRDSLEGDLRRMGINS
ncbi:Bgt-1492 [Blumeria graminis f. sp. tritici]|uniref:Bgt-1492 n=2 Tax=Blumeria graminis f. sp. tritici TaxID=62690 RepID=A0A381LC85_BLUGR|nr:Receptor for alpha-factor pheromone [Blumeria graminis f. sp. tritici 96224]VCU41265.1 Bgt-1492 [Blumeria graminis f. sp. tritici]